MSYDGKHFLHSSSSRTNLRHFTGPKIPMILILLKYMHQPRALSRTQKDNFLPALHVSLWQLQMEETTPPYVYYYDISATSIVPHWFNLRMVFKVVDSKLHQRWGLVHLQ